MPAMTTRPPVQASHVFMTLFLLIVTVLAVLAISTAWKASSHDPATKPDFRVKETINHITVEPSDEGQ